jgi:dihydrodipicolinate reductase
MLNITMCGASGRMGRNIIPLIEADPDLRLAGALAAPGDAALGADAGLVAGGQLFEAAGAATFMYSAGLILASCAVAWPLLRVAQAEAGGAGP